MKTTKKYSASLINKSGCNFDKARFSNYKELKSWARGRGGRYTLVVSIDGHGDEDIYRAVNNRLYYDHTC
jgi:hypothetical protein